MRAIYLALTLGLAVATVVPTTTTTSTTRAESNPLISKRDRYGGSRYGESSGNIFEDYYGFGSSKTRNPHTRGGLVSELEEEVENVYPVSRHISESKFGGVMHP